MPSLSSRVWSIAAKALVQTWLEHALVQILVVVANIQIRTLKTEVEKVFASTAVVRESAGC